MLSKEEESIDAQETEKFFRVFEISNKWHEMKYVKKSKFNNLSKIIAGFTQYQFLSYYFTTPPQWRLFVRRLLRQERMVPDYVMTGPPKSGSSDLVSHLMLHPNVMHPLAKETRLDVNKDWRLFYPTLKKKRKLEEKMSHPVRCGCHDPLLHNMNFMDKLYNANPNSKIIITLRDPVPRAYSDWKYQLLLRGQSLAKLPHVKDYSNYVDRALDMFPSITLDLGFGSRALQHGIYYKAVEYWIERFGKENVLVLNVADYFSSRQPTLEKIQRFLDLPVVQIPEYSKKANENPIKMPPPDQQTKTKLAEFYRPYNEKLFDLIGTEFDWQ